MAAENGWSKKKVAELISSGVLRIDDGYRVRNVELGPEGIPFVRGGDIEIGSVNTTVEDHIRPEFADRVQKKLAMPGDVAFISKGTVGRVGMLRSGQPSVVFAPQVCYWRSLDLMQLNPLFLFYLLRSHEFQSNLYAVKTHGSMVADYVSMSDQRAFEITIPPIGIQESIASVLGTLDDKIELNRRMNETLEGIARALFKSWFVDFDPVRAKMDGRQPAGMAPEIANLFPSEFEHINGELVPKGWRLCTVPDVIDINPTRRLSKGCVATYLDMKNMPTNGHHPEEWTPREMGSGTKFINGDTLMARITPCLENGKTAFVDFLIDGETGWGSTEYIVLRPREPLPVEFGYYLARSEEFRLHAITNMTGSSGRQRVPNDCFAQFVMAIPPADIASAFGKIVRSIMRSIRANCGQSRTAASLRDTLLPKLLSGELRVPEADKVLEEVL